jgi:hypothetical protein
MSCPRGPGVTVTCTMSTSRMARCVRRRCSTRPVPLHPPLVGPAGRLRIAPAAALIPCRACPPNPRRTHHHTSGAISSRSGGGRCSAGPPTKSASAPSPTTSRGLCTCSSNASRSSAHHPGHPPPAAHRPSERWGRSRALLDLSRACSWSPLRADHFGATAGQTDHQDHRPSLAQPDRPAKSRPLAAGGPAAGTTTRAPDPNPRVEAQCASKHCMGRRPAGTTHSTRPLLRSRHFHRSCALAVMG